MLGRGGGEGGGTNSAIFFLILLQPPPSQNMPWGIPSALLNIFWGNYKGYSSERQRESCKVYDCAFILMSTVELTLLKSEVGNQ